MLNRLISLAKKPCIPYTNKWHNHLPSHLKVYNVQHRAKYTLRLFSNTVKKSCRLLFYNRTRMHPNLSPILHQPQLHRLLQSNGLT